PKTSVQPILPRAHWEPKSGSIGARSVWRCLLFSARVTLGSSWYFLRIASAAFAGTSMIFMLRRLTRAFSEPPLRATVAACSFSERPGAIFTMIVTFSLPPAAEAFEEPKRPIRKIAAARARTEAKARRRRESEYVRVRMVFLRQCL